MVRYLYRRSVHTYVSKSQLCLATRGNRDTRHISEWLDSAAFLKAHVMSPLNKWLDSATEGSDINGSQGFHQDKDSAILEVVIPAGKGVV